MHDRVEHDGRRRGAAFVMRHRPPAGKGVPRYKLNARKYVDLEQYIADYTSKRIFGYARLPRKKRIELFGSTIIPIHVPLARGETAQQYEERFIQWLGEQGLTLRELETSEDDFKERVYRVEFANWAATQSEAYVSASKKRSRPVEGKELLTAMVKRKRATEEGEATKGDEKIDELPVPRADKVACCSVQRPLPDTSTVAVADPLTACGCQRCLVETMRFLANKITELDQLVS